MQPHWVMHWQPVDKNEITQILKHNIASRDPHLYNNNNLGFISLHGLFGYFWKHLEYIAFDTPLSYKLPKEGTSPQSHSQCLLRDGCFTASVWSKSFQIFTTFYMSNNSPNPLVPTAFLDSLSLQSKCGDCFS